MDVTVDQLKATRKSKKKSFNTYASRRDDIKDIISDIDKKLDNEISAVNKKIESCASELEAGLTGCSTITNVCSELALEKEVGTESDVKISDCRANLVEEQKWCQKKINALDAEIKSLEQQIRDQGGTIYFWE